MRMFGWGEGQNVKESFEQNRGSSVLSGYLWKMKREKKTVVPQWSKRWFSIEGRNLKWYKISSSESASGSIELKSITGAFRFESGGKGVFSFIVYCSDRNLLLRASNASEMKMWLRAIQMQADLANGGNGTGILCKSNNQADGLKSQKKLRSHTLQSELNRKMMELDNLERSIIVSEEKGSTFQEEESIRYHPQNETDTDSYRGNINVGNEYKAENQHNGNQNIINDNVVLHTSSNNNNSRSSGYYKSEERQLLMDQNRNNVNNSNSRYSTYSVDEKEAPRSTNNNIYTNHIKSDYHNSPDDVDDQEDSGFRIRKPNSKSSSRRYGSRDSDSQFSEPKLSIDRSQSKSSRAAWL